MTNINFIRIFHKFHYTMRSSENSHIPSNGVRRAPPAAHLNDTQLREAFERSQCDPRQFVFYRYVLRLINLSHNEEVIFSSQCLYNYYLIR
jgi:hypothetical protein